MPIGLYGGEEKGDNSQDVESDIEIDRIQIIQEQSRAVAKTARANIELTLHNHEQLASLETRTLEMEERAKGFNVGSEGLRTRFCKDAYRNLFALFAVAVIGGVLLWLIIDNA